MEKMHSLEKARLKRDRDAGEKGDTIRGGRDVPSLKS